MDEVLTNSADVVKYLAKKNHIVLSSTMEFYEHNTLLVTIKLKFWRRLLCLLFSDIRDDTWFTLTEELNAKKDSPEMDIIVNLLV